MSAAKGRIDGIVARLHGLHPKLIDLTLDRLRVLLAKLGNPERRLPPVIHVAGTNGKGSTCAFLRAMAEAAGLRVHVYTSPHLVRFNERIRVAGELVADADVDRVHVVGRARLLEHDVDFVAVWRRPGVELNHGVTSGLGEFA